MKIKSFLVAWILWQNITAHDGTEDWSYIEAYKERSWCEVFSAELLDRINPSTVVQEIIWRGPGMVKYLTKGGHTFKLSHLCVPDTVDPRPRR